MLRKLRPRRPSPATVVAYLGLFVALGGTAYAVNTVGSADIIDESIQSADIKNGEVKSVDIGNGEVNSADVKDQSLSTFDVHTFLGVDVVDNTLTGDDIFESSLGQVPTAANSDKLDGIDSTGFVQGQGRIVSFDRALAANNEQTLFTLPGLVGSVQAQCPSQPLSQDATYEILAPSSSSLDLLNDFGGENPGHHHLNANDSLIVNAAPNGDSHTLSFESQGKLVTVFAFSYAVHNPTLNQDFCQFQGHAIVNGS